MKDNFKNAVNIFNKYASSYEEKYMDVSLYENSLEGLLKMLSTEAKVLDLGCGPGNISAFFLRQRPGLEITCVDAAEKMLRIAKKNNPTADCRLMDIREVETLDKKFDAVVCGFCLPYLTRQETEKLLKDISKILNKHGLLYLSTMEDSYSNSGVKKSSSGEDELFIFYYEAEYLKDLLKQNGFKILYEEMIPQPEDQPSSGQDIVLIARQ
ncbi:class I SAM-dependent methyltransferase [Christiangramia fulva]|uniref:Class I SAM-dependent methyltransferase n=1 Tax=Christiangramia fulva TaxID=2126553 RepID=A0A2R3Z6W3_9FLAO|nr:class I SAM-dependent methyltransferase [Christiangramia fulva]AVR45995.1 class I SAM-dependent methyltransferase [Christiangramia fulva]